MNNLRMKIKKELIMFREIINKLGLDRLKNNEKGLENAYKSGCYWAC